MINKDIQTDGYTESKSGQTDRQQNRPTKLADSEKICIQETDRQMQKDTQTK